MHVIVVERQGRPELYSFLVQQWFATGALTPSSLCFVWGNCSTAGEQRALKAKLTCRAGYMYTFAGFINLARCHGSQTTVQTCLYSSQRT